MRIEPEQQIAARTRQPESGRNADKGFASTLASLRDASTTGPQRATETSRPAAEQWGQFGQGATPAGFGPAPDPAQFAHHPTGAGTTAHPLNSRGNTGANPAFTVPGYTVRGTPIPPGFYNLAYYNQYLAEGGTPLVGFEAYDPANGSLTDVYGTFGDGQERATSFTSGLVQSGETAPASATAVLALDTTSAPAPNAAEHAAAFSATNPAPAPVPADVAAHGQVDSAPAAAAPTTNTAAPDDAPSIGHPGTLLTDTAHQAVRLALQTLLDDLLSIA